MSLDSSYWTISHGHANRTGWSCRECHGVIYQGEPMVIRDGRKLRLMYHERCFSGSSDPRTQNGSSYNDNKWANTNSIREKAPPVKGYGKWSCSEYGYKGDFYTTPNSVKHRDSESDDAPSSRTNVTKSEYSNKLKKINN